MRFAWVWWLVAGVPTALGYYLVPEGSLLAALLFEGLGVVSTVLMAVAIRRRRPAHPLLWYLLLGGTAFSVVGDGIYDYLANVAHVDAYPSVAEPFYLLSYPLSAAGLALLVRRRTAGRDRVGLIDAAIVSTALALPAWTFLVAPIGAAEHTGLADQLVSLAYPVLDVLLIAMTARLLTAPGRLVPAFWLLIAAQVTRLLPDITFSAGSLTDSDPISWFDSGWILTYVLTTAAALHPSMRRITDPVAPRGDALSAPRLTLLTASSLLAPAVLVGQGLTRPATIDWTAVAAGSAVLFLLVVARMKLLLNRLHRLARQLDSLARLDGLTGVPNRRSWDEALHRELVAAGRSGTPVVVALLDLDLFKVFNDSHGHQAGDLLLKEAVAAWRAGLRESDLLARYGGEEFGIVVTGRPADEVLEVVSRLRAMTPRGQTFSAGLARWDGTESADELVGRADRALYAAKAAGRDRVLACGEITLAR